VLDVEGAVSRDGSRWVREPGSDWVYDAERYEHITALRRREQATMASFGADGRCLMRALQEELDDPDPQDCGRCSVCTRARYDGPLDPALVREAIDHLRSQPLTLEAKKMAPDAEGRMKRIPAEYVVEEGRALARLGDGGWAPVVQAGLREGRFSGELLDAVDRLVRAWNPPVGWITTVPSVRHPGGVDDLAQRLAGTLGIPYVALLERTGDRPPQREMSNSAMQAANVRGAFRVAGDPPADGCLLLDDTRLSGWTLAMTGGQLRRRGSGPVFPLALATAF
jgi:ATP-dependent DNA helicase RecQ